MNKPSGISDIFPMGKKYPVQLFSQHQETFLSLSIIEPFESITHSLRGMWIDVDLTFYLIMQVIAIQYIINIFSGNFVWHKLDDIQNSKKLAKYSYQLISYMNFSLVLENFQLWKKNVKENNFPKNKHFLPPDTHTYMCVSGCKKCLFFGMHFMSLRQLWFAMLNPNIRPGIFRADFSWGGVNLIPSPCFIFEEELI